MLVNSYVLPEEMKPEYRDNLDMKGFYKTIAGALPIALGLTFVPYHPAVNHTPQHNYITIEESRAEAGILETLKYYKKLLSKEPYEQKRYIAKVFDKFFKRVYYDIVNGKIKEIYSMGKNWYNVVFEFPSYKVKGRDGKEYEVNSVVSWWWGNSPFVKSPVEDLKRSGRVYGIVLVIDTFIKEGENKYRRIEHLTIHMCGLLYVYRNNEEVREPGIAERVLTFAVGQSTDSITGENMLNYQLWLAVHIDSMINSGEIYNYIRDAYKMFRKYAPHKHTSKNNKTSWNRNHRGIPLNQEVMRAKARNRV